MARAARIFVRLSRGEERGDPLTPAHTCRYFTNRIAPTRRYDFDKHHDGLKQIGNNVDMIFLGCEALGLLNFFGDFEAARTCIAKVNDANKRILTRVKKGAASADGCVHATRTLSPLLPPFFLQHSR